MSGFVQIVSRFHIECVLCDHKVRFTNYRQHTTYVTRYSEVVGFLCDKNSKLRIVSFLIVYQTTFADAYRGVLGESFKAFEVKLNITTRRHSNIGPNMAPSHPSQNIPPAIDRPVKYACPPLQYKYALLALVTYIYIYTTLELFSYPFTSAYIAGSTKLVGKRKCTRSKIMPNEKRS